MSGESAPEGLALKELEEEELWELINDNRHRISLGVRHCRLIPYLRQAQVLTEMDEDEINTCHSLTNRCMRTSYMLDLLRNQGRNGAVALLESLMIHYPTIYTKVTGRTSSTDLSRFSGLVKYSELTEYLVRAVTGMQRELQEARSEASRLSDRCISLEAELGQTVEQEETFRCLKSESERLRRHLCSLQKDVTKLKDEKCELYMRYTSAIEEKSAVNMRLHDLNLQVYQLQTELLKAQKENDSQKRSSLRCMLSAETPQLQEKVKNLCYQLEKAEKLNPACQDILARDLAEAIDSQMELAEQLRSYREENEKLLREKQELLEKSESLSLVVQQLTLDCDMHQQKSTLVQSQMRELQKERDQAYVSRDEAQAMIARILAEKDTIRCQLVEVQDKVLCLQSKRLPREERQSSDEKDYSWDSPASSFEETPGGNRRRLRRMDAINPLSLPSGNSECEQASNSSIRSRTAEPPSPESLRRRKESMSAESSLETSEMESFSDDFVFLPKDCSEDRRAKLTSCHGSHSERTTDPPFLLRSRPKAIRISGRVLSISLQGEALLSQLTVVGGNKTGVFVHLVTDGSPAHKVQYQQNKKALRMVLEESTLEEAMWALGQVSGLCQLSVRPRQDVAPSPHDGGLDYEELLKQMQVDETSSGDSFYVRVNMSLSASANETLSISCNDILHVTNTQPAGTEDSWHVSQVHPCQLLDLQSGTVPNYYRAQRVLIGAIEDMSFQTKKPHRTTSAETKNTEKKVRIVSTGHQGRNLLWVSVEENAPKATVSGESSAPSSCVTLMPYSPVTPHYPPTCRPVLLLPSVLGRILDKKLSSWQGFQLIEAESLSPSAHAALLQKSEILEESEHGSGCSYTLHGVERVMQKGIHAVLPLGLDCVRRLHRAKIFPIIIFVAQSQRSARKLRTKLQRHIKSEKQLLMCSESEEPLLDKLPCLYHRLAPDSWCDQRSLLTSLRTVIWEEQKKIVWVEPDLW